MKNKLNAVFSEFSVKFFLARKRPVNLIYIQRHDLSLALELRKSRRDKFRSVFWAVSPVTVTFHSPVHLDEGLPAVSSRLNYRLCI